MKHRYLSKLEAELAEARSPSVENKLLGQIAFHYARLGKTEAATAAIEKVRSHVSQVTYDSGAAVCWINLAEGIIEHYAANTRIARSKWERSRAVARSLGLREVAAISSAWLALSAYLAEDVQYFESSSVESVRLSDEENYSAISRVSLNVALCFHYGDVISSARDWYTRCRLAAVRDGDEATLAALMHSMGWMSISSKRNQALMKGGQVAQGDLLSITAETVQSYESLVGAANLPAMTPLLFAQNCLLEENYEIAIKIIDEHCAAACSQGFGRLAPGLLADRAYCLASVGRLREAENDAMRAYGMTIEELHSDDLAVFHSRLAATFSLLKINTHSQLHGEKAIEAWDKLNSFKMEMVDAARAIEVASGENPAFQFR
jgi:hypothetical protein